MLIFTQLVFLILSCSLWKKNWEIPVSFLRWWWEDSMHKFQRLGIQGLACAFLSVHHRCALLSMGRIEWWRPLVCLGSNVSCSSVKLSGLPAPSKELPQLEFGDNMSWRRSSCTMPVSLFPLPLWFPSSSWSLSSLAKKLMYFIAKRKISFLLSFLSGGWVGMSLRSSAKAPLTFCCLHLSRLFVNMRRTTLVWGPKNDQKHKFSHVKKL